MLYNIKLHANVLHLCLHVVTCSVADDVVTESCYGLLWHLAAYPLQGLFTAYAVARHDALSPHFVGSYHTNDDVERYTLVEVGIEEYGTLKPLAA